MHGILGLLKVRLVKGGRIALAAIGCILALAMGLAFPTVARADIATDAQVVHRLYNRYSGKHLYTTDANELATLVDAGWEDEGIGWYDPKVDGAPIYRLYNRWTHEHLYTATKVEYDQCVAMGWNGEGVKLHTADRNGEPIFRLFNPYAKGAKGAAAHLFTTDSHERDVLLKAGYRSESIAFYGYVEPEEKPPPLLDPPEEGDALALGSFFVDTPGEELDFATVLCTTRNGVDFTFLDMPFGSTVAENPYHDPSIIYHDGYFYILSNWNRQNGRFNPMFSYSPDLVTWSQPEGGELINRYEGYEGIPLESDPFGIENFDVVAPEFFVDDDGSVYLLFSAGYYGAFHGEPERDRMLPYFVKIELSNDGFAEPSISGKPFPKGLRLSYGVGREFRGLDPSDNYIDSSMYKEDGVYYLLTKKDGVINQIYANDRLAPTGWTKVNDRIAIGNEGPSLAKISDTYLLYTDQIATFHGKAGIQVSLAKGIDEVFDGPRDVTCDNGMILRHGSVMVLEGEAKEIVERFLENPPSEDEDEPAEDTPVEDEPTGDESTGGESAGDETTGDELPGDGSGGNEAEGDEATDGGSTGGEPSGEGPVEGS